MMFIAVLTIVCDILLSLYPLAISKHRLTVLEDKLLSSIVCRQAEIDVRVPLIRT